MIKHIPQEKWSLVVYKWCSDRFSTLWENPSEEVDDENDYYDYDYYDDDDE